MFGGKRLWGKKTLQVCTFLDQRSRNFSQYSIKMCFLNWFFRWICILPQQWRRYHDLIWCIYDMEKKQNSRKIKLWSLHIKINVWFSALWEMWMYSQIWNLEPIPAFDEQVVGYILDRLPFLQQESMHAHSGQLKKHQFHLTWMLLDCGRKLECRQSLHKHGRWWISQQATALLPVWQTLKPQHTPRPSCWFDSSLFHVPILII